MGKGKVGVVTGGKRQGRCREVAVEGRMRKGWFTDRKLGLREAT